MAAGKSLDEEIKCRVCFDIYEDPHILIDCLHTFCLKCIKRLEVKGQVQCPDCKTVTHIKDIKQDFKIQRLIDIYNQSLAGSKITKRDDKCGLCHNESVLITHQCTDCEMFLCAECSKGHQNDPALKSHKLMSSSTLRKNVGSNLQETIRRLENQMTNIDTKLKSVSESLTDVEKAKTQQIADVRKFTMDAIEELKKNQKQLEAQVTEANENLVNHLHLSKTMLEQQRKDLLPKITSLKHLTKSQDMRTLQETTKTVNETLKQDIIKIQKIIERKRVNLRSPVTVQKIKTWDAKDNIEVSVHSIQYDSQQIGPVTETMYSDLYAKSFTLTHTTDLSFFPFGLSMINNQLWCPGGNHCLNVFDLNCQQVAEIEHEQITCPESIATCGNEYVIVACSDNQGLHLLQSNGEYHSKIMDGNFADVVCYDGDLFALEYEIPKVIILRRDGNHWNEVNSHQLLHSNGDSWDRLAVHSNGIYISSYLSDCVYVFDKDGNFQFTRGESGSERPGELNNPFLCSVDSDGNMLVADRWNNRLQVCDTIGYWSIAPLPARMKFPRDVVVSDEGEMWIASSGLPRKLERYTMTSGSLASRVRNISLIDYVLHSKVTMIMIIIILIVGLLLALQYLETNNFVTHIGEMRYRAGRN